MSSSNYKLNHIRHSGQHIELSNKINKVASRATKELVFKRMNTECNEKSSNTKRYLLKRATKCKQNNRSSLSKQNHNPYRVSHFLNRVSFNDFQVDCHTQDISCLHKKANIKKNNYTSKFNELDEILRKKDQRKTNKTQININSLNKKEKNKAAAQINQIFMLKQLKMNQFRNRVEKSPAQRQLRYKMISNTIIGAGTFGKVYAAIDNQTGQKVAIKKVYNDKNYKCRQIDLMQKVESDFVVKLLDKYNTNEFDEDIEKQYTNIVMPKYESSFFQFLKSVKYRVEPYMLKIYLYQVFRGIMHLHSRKICHRDLKPQNILIKDNRLAICDLGSAKILKKQQSNISYICSRCYRAPELIFGATNYTFSIDIWSAGCIILQILNKGPFFIAKDSLHHLIQIMKVMGTPTKKQILSMNPNYDISNYDLPIIKKLQWSDVFTHTDPLLLDLISKIMTYNPNLRLTSEKVLSHPYFDDIRDQKFTKEIAHQISIKNFFSFDQLQIGLMSKPYILIPKWYLQ